MRYPRHLSSLRIAREKLVGAARCARRCWKKKRFASTARAPPVNTSLRTSVNPSHDRGVTEGG